MGIEILKGSELAKELAKWEQFPTSYTTERDGDAPVGNPYQFRMFPKMLYRALVTDQGRTVCMEEPPVLKGGTGEAQAQHAYEMAQWERRTQQCSRIVRSEDEERAARNDGWRTSPADALAAHEQRDLEVFRAEAEAAAAATKLSSKAQAERDKREKSTSGPLTT